MPLYENTKFRLPEDLYQYQVQDGDKVAQEGQNWLLCHEMGVGKTPITIGAIEKAGYKFPLIICPNSLRYEWARQIEEWTGQQSALSGTYYASGGKMGDIIGSLVGRNHKKYRIINYETLRVPYAADLLKAIPWDVVVFDEIHKLRNVKSYHLKKVVKGAWDLLDAIRSPKVVGISGSPIMNYPDDLYGPLACVAPDRYPRTLAGLRNFMRKYMMYATGQYGSYAFGTRDIRSLKAETQDLIIRRTKKEVLSFLPDKYYQRPELEMQDDQRKVYNQMENELKILLDTGEPLWSPGVLSTLTRLRQINLDPRILGVSASSAKTEYLEDLVESTDEKIVVFSCFERYIDLLATLFKDKNPAVITGKIPVGEPTMPGTRQAEVKRFQEDENCRLFLGTVQCAGEGITLTAASTVVMADRWWNEPANQQCVDRLHRIGQKSAVQVLLPIVSKSIDAVLDAILQRKHEASQAYYEENEVRESVFSSLGSSRAS